MTNRHSILCPVDFSDASAAALRYAAAIADHFAAQLIVLAVDDLATAGGPELQQAPRPDPEALRNDLLSFVRGVSKDIGSLSPALRYETAVGIACTEILRVAREASVDLIVMGSHGRTGLGRLVIGSTTERVLRDTNVPVLVTPHGPGPQRLEDLLAAIRRIVVPLDFSPGGTRQTQVAFSLASALGIPVTLLHVLEFAPRPIAGGSQLAALEQERREQVIGQLRAIAEGAPAGVVCDIVVVAGKAAEETARVTRETQAGLVVMGLQDVSRPRAAIGSVTYGVLCHAPALVLALPSSVTQR